jgi:virulence factor Mce-like protein
MKPAADTRPPKRARPRDLTLFTGILILLLGAGIMFVSYGAQNGLPWAQPYEIEIAVPDAGKLAKNAEVRIGGARVGQVVVIRAVPREGEVPPHAVLELKLDKEVGPLPVDTKAEVRLGSVLGGKYIELVPGRSSKTIPEHGRLALENSSATVDMDDAFRIFDPAGRRSLRRVIGALAEGLAGRGEALNETAGVLVDTLPVLNRVLATLSDPRTELGGFVRGAAAATSALAAVSPVLGPFVRNTAVTFRALDDAGDSLGDTVEALPGAADSATSALGTLQPVLDDAAALARDLEPAAAALRPTAANLHTTMRTAIRVDPQVGTLAVPLDRTLRSLDTFVAEPAGSNTLRLLGSGDLATVGASAVVGLGSVIETTWEAEKHCRVATQWIAHQREMTSDGDAGGNWIRMLPVIALREMLPASEPTDDLHANPYPNANAQECEAGNEGHAEGQLIGNPPGLQGAPGGGK